MTPENMFDHIKDDTIWKAMGTALMALLAALIGAIKMLYNKEHKAIDCLYNWKDEVVDPHIRKIPEVYVSAQHCNSKHEESFALYDKRHDELIDEIRHIRGILEKHLINGFPKA